MKKILSAILVLSCTVVTEARNRPREKNAWDEIKEELVCVTEMRIFLRNNSGYLSSPLSSTPEVSSVTGVPKRKLKCDDRLVEDLGDGLGQCSADPSRNPYRFSGFGFDCPSKTISRLKISDEVKLQIELYDKCDTQRTGDLFSDQEIIKSPSNMHDGQMQTMAADALQEAIIDIYNKIDMSSANAGLNRNRIEGIEQQLGQNIFGRVNCSVRHFRDPETGPVMRQAIDRVCGQKRTVLNQPERCMLNAPESYGTYARAPAARPEVMPAGVSSPAPAPALSPAPSADDELPPARAVDDDGD